MEHDFKELVLKNAREIFMKFGYSKTTMNDIAKACHKSKGLIYHHFESKEEIFRKVVSIELNAIMVRIKDELDQADTTPERFEKFIRAFIEYTTDTTNLFHKVLFEISDFYLHVKDIVEDFKTYTNNSLSELLNKGKEEKLFTFDDEEETRKTILIILAGFVKPPFSEYDVDMFEKPKTDTVIDLIFSGIVNRL